MRGSYVAFASLLIGFLGLWMTRRRRAQQRELTVRASRARTRRRQVPAVSSNLKGVLAEDEATRVASGRPRLEIEFHWKRGGDEER